LLLGTLGVAVAVRLPAAREGPAVRGVPAVVVAVPQPVKATATIRLMSVTRRIERA